MMKLLRRIVDWLYYLSLELFTSAHIDRGRGVNHFYDDKRAHILTCSIIHPWISLLVCIVLYIFFPNFNLKINNRLIIIGIIVILYAEFFIMKKYDFAISLFERHKEEFSRWEKSKQVLMTLLPVVLCILSWITFFFVFDILYDK